MIDREWIEQQIAVMAGKGKQDLTDYIAHPSHFYTDNTGEHLISVKSRYKHPQTGDKWMRSYHINAKGKLVYGEPRDYNSAYPDGNGLKPLYLLPNVVSNTDAMVYLVEGENVADLLTQLGIVATTTGGSTQTDKYHWGVLAGRNVTVWADNDKSGAKWLHEVCLILDGLGCHLSVIDVGKLGLNEKDDAVDWIANKRQSQSKISDAQLVKAIKKLPTLTDEQLLIITNHGKQSDSSITNPNQDALLEPSIPYKNGWIEHRHDGLYFATYDDDGQPKLSTFICSPLEVLARSSDATSASWGIVLRWCNRNGVTHTWAMPIAKLYGNNGEYRSELADKGLIISPQTNAQQLLDHYLVHHPTDKIALCVNKTGWHDNVYVTPERTLGGNDKQMIVYQPDWYSEPIYSQCGTLEQWTNEVCKPLAEQTRIVLAISCGFAGQLLALVNMQGAGFHLQGGSSMGKSIGQKVAGSIWGSKKFVGSWRTTDNALEGRALMANDGFLALDEISEGEPKAVAKAIYMIMNGQGKDRAKASGGNRPTKSWQTILLSNGEKTLNQFMQDAGLKVNAGQEVRLINIEADAGKGLRSFDSLVLADTPEVQADIINDLSQRYYGTAGIAWLEYLTQNKAQCTATAKAYIDRFMSQYSDIKGQAYRVGKHFALLATAGEMATEAGITGWQAGQASHAVMVCFNNWLDNYGRDGNHEARQIIKNLQAFIARHGTSRFQPWTFASFDAPRISDRVGWHKQDTDEYYFYPDLFGEVCGDYPVKTVLQVLDDAGILVRKERDRKTYKTALPDSKKRKPMYLIKGDVLNLDLNKTNGTSGTAGQTHKQQGLYGVPCQKPLTGQAGHNEHKSNNLSRPSRDQKTNGTAVNPVTTVIVPLSRLSHEKNSIQDFDNDLNGIPDVFLESSNIN